MFRRALAGTRYLIVIAVIGTFLASIAVLVYGALTVVTTIIDIFTHGGFKGDIAARNHCIAGRYVSWLCGQLGWQCEHSGSRHCCRVGIVRPWLALK